MIACQSLKQRLNYFTQGIRFIFVINLLQPSLRLTNTTKLEPRNRKVKKSKPGIGLSRLDQYLE
jgi:hypothetical protein